MSRKRETLFELAGSCTRVRSAIGQLMLAEHSVGDVSSARRDYRDSLRRLLVLAREEDCGLYLEVAGDLAAQQNGSWTATQRPA